MQAMSEIKRVSSDLGGYGEGSDPNSAGEEEDEFNLYFCEENFNELIRRAKELRRLRNMCEKAHRSEISAR